MTIGIANMRKIPPMITSPRADAPGTFAEGMSVGVGEGEAVAVGDGVLVRIGVGVGVRVAVGVGVGV